MKKGSSSKKIIGGLFAIAAMFGMTGNSNSQFITNNQYHAKGISKDAINQVPPSVRPIAIKRNFTGGDNPYKYYRKGIRNQKEYRRHLRSNPSLRRSKKCRV